MLRLTILNGEAQGRSFEAAEGEIHLGRAQTNDLVLPDFHVSAAHCHIRSVFDGFVVRDAQSTNGTRVRRGDETIVVSHLPERETPLASGDIIEIGDAEHPIHIAVGVEEDEDSARIVTLRNVRELARADVQSSADHALVARLYAATKRVTAQDDLDDVVSVVAAEVFEFLPRATHVTVALREDDERGAPRYVPVGTRVRAGGRSAEGVPVSKSIFRKVVSERAAVLAADARRDVGETASIMGAQILSTIGMPLWHGEEIFGVLQVDNRGSAGVFREADLDVLGLLAQSAGEALLRAQLMRRLRVAEDRLRKENSYLKKREQTRREGHVIGESPAMQAIFKLVRKVVDTRVSVLVEGETGTGKELIASAVHYWSNRRDKLFVAQNCAALPENLLESELFGHKKGAFTGATDEKKGLFELADGGTLFLDEVGEMPLSLQAKLLRVLQEGEIRPVGGTVTKRVDVRIVAATNRDLEKEVAEGRFRQDLFYRLRVFPIRIPGLRERREDIPLLARHFLKRYSEEFGKPVAGFSQIALELLTAYDWPGNVRELENEVQRLVIGTEPDAFVEPPELSPRIKQVGSVVDRIQPTKGTLREMMDQVEQWLLLEALREHDNNKTATAKTLGITREGLHKKLRSLGIG
jgi:transcriptional regulator with GAF, ATPase, and Fis domain